MMPLFRVQGYVCGRTAATTEQVFIGDCIGIIPSMNCVKGIAGNTTTFVICSEPPHRLAEEKNSDLLRF